MNSLKNKLIIFDLSLILQIKQVLYLIYIKDNNLVQFLRMSFFQLSRNV